MLANRSQRDQDHTRRAAFGDRACGLEGQTGLSGSAGSGERDETRGGIREPIAQSLQVSLASDEDRRRQRQRDAAQFIDRRELSRFARASHERVAGRRREVEGRRERADGLDVGTSSFTAFERAHGVDR